MKTTVTVKFGDISLDITGFYDAGYPELYAYSNGDPGYPEEPPSFDIDSVVYNDKDITQLMDSMNDVFCLLGKKLDKSVYLDLWIYLEGEVLDTLKD